jgi:hypothetical protein
MLTYVLTNYHSLADFQQLTPQITGAMRAPASIASELICRGERTAIVEKFLPIFRLILHNLLIPAGIYL